MPPHLKEAFRLQEEFWILVGGCGLISLLLGFFLFRGERKLPASVAARRPCLWLLGAASALAIARSPQLLPGFWVIDRPDFVRLTVPFIVTPALIGYLCAAAWRRRSGAQLD